MSSLKDAYYGDRNNRPPRPEFHGTALPVGLRPLPRWIGWRFGWKESDSKWAKLPLNPNQRCKKLAKTNDPKTWADLSTSVASMNAAYLANPQSVDGIGFVFADGDDLFGLDIDGCRNVETGALSELAVRLISSFDTYSEVSPSGMGVKLIGRGTFEGKGRKVKLPDGQELELYTRGRYFTLTGIRVDGTPADIADCAAPLAKFIDEFKLVATEEKPTKSATHSKSDLTDDEIIDKLTRTAKNAAEGNRLWRGDTSGNSGDDSAADLALCNLIAFYTADPARIDSIFRRSGLMREKWERADYSSGTIAKALEGRTAFYGERNGKLGHPAAAGTGTGFALTDMGNAERLIAHHGHNLKRVGLISMWYLWDGKRWAEDETESIDHLMKDTVRMIGEEAAKEKEATRRPKILQHAISSESKSYVKSAVELAKSDPAVAVRLEDFNSDPMLLNCANGTLNLANRELREHTRGDMITGLCPTVYDPDAACPQWERTLALIFPADPQEPDAGPNKGLVTYIQRLFGLCLTGLVDEAILPIFWGGGANGKSTILNTVRAVLGNSYAIQAPHNFLMAKQNENHPTELTDLHHRRLVIATESRKSRRIDEALVKWLTGGERIRARRMRQDFFEFDPTHKLILCTNHKPRVSEGDEGIWRRLALIPFLVKFWNPDKKGSIGPDCLRQDKKLGRALLKEASGILAWMVRGCLSWQEDGLEMPPEVEDQTEEYRTDEDVIGRYLIERVNIDNRNFKELFSEVYQDYRDWCANSGINPVSSKAFSNELKDKNHSLKRGAHNNMYCLGFELKEIGGVTG